MINDFLDEKSGYLKDSRFNCRQKYLYKFWLPFFCLFTAAGQRGDRTMLQKPKRIRAVVETAEKKKEDTDKYICIFP